MSDLPDIDIAMWHPDLAQAPRVAAPPGYAIRGFRAGDGDTWVRLQSHDPFDAPTLATFAASMPGDVPTLAERVMFLLDPAGREIGTITAWRAPFRGTWMGQIHWVALIPAVQGRGLGHALLGAGCARLALLGERAAFLTTNIRRVAALGLYLRAGFIPQPQSTAERAAWLTLLPRLRLPAATRGAVADALARWPDDREGVDDDDGDAGA
jgi:GNAT superfamily N-acetyltransferase